jgi:polysaccharide biosynthesis/export protein
MLRSFVRSAAALALCSALAGCGHFLPEMSVAPARDFVAAREAPVWGETVVEVVADFEAEGPYLLDSGDRLRIFVYANPNLSRLYTVDQQGMVSVPLIGEVSARGKTTRGLARAIAARLGAQYVKEPQVTVDIALNRPFFILGEVRNAGQYPYVSGMTAQAAVAIAGGYADRADERRIQITRRRINGFIEKMDVPPDYVVQPGDTIYVYERWL